MKNKRFNLFIFSLFFSVILSLLGIFFTIDAYYKNLSVLAAKNYFEFFKTLPSIISKNEKVYLPKYFDDTILKTNKFLSGYITCDYYNNQISLKKIDITISRYKLIKIKLYSLIDARIRKK